MPELVVRHFWFCGMVSGMWANQYEQFPGSDLAFYPGAEHAGSNTRFVVWAPDKESVSLKLLDPEERVIELKKSRGGFWSEVVPGIEPGTRYWFRLDDDRDRPDPASRCQPEGVHGPSAVVDLRSFEWPSQEAAWQPKPWRDWVVYELHVGAFTGEGTFEAVIPRLPDLVDLGVNAIEIMPVAQFPGTRNWGYDGVYPFATQYNYGGVDGLRKLVAACHQAGLAVVMDVVYNHLGPEGNYLWDFGPYFTDHYKTPWGWAVNFDGEHSDAVRAYFEANVRMWFEDFHLDALRLDAVHAIYDFSAKPFLAELNAHVRAWSDELGRALTLIAESDQNDRRVTEPREKGGLGFHAQWSDDFHHCVHVLLTGERNGYYANYNNLDDLATCLRQGWTVDGRYASSRRRRHGNSPGGLPAERFCVCIQNHDQVGNRALGERFTSLVSYEQRKLAAALLCLSPFVPLLFMGEEYAEPNPFLYFVDHSDEGLIKGVREGRKKEFADFHAQGEPPDPFSPETLRNSTLNWHLRTQDSAHGALWRCYRELLLLRQRPSLSSSGAEDRVVDADSDEHLLWMLRGVEPDDALIIFNFDEDPCEVPMAMVTKPVKESADLLWKKIFDSAHPKWLGPGELTEGSVTPEGMVKLRPHSAIVFERQ